MIGVEVAAGDENGCDIGGRDIVGGCVGFAAVVFGPEFGRLFGAGIGGSFEVVLAAFLDLGGRESAANRKNVLRF